MRLTLMNPPHTAIGKRVPREHLPPLGHLAIGGPLIDAGHNVTLLNADPAPMDDPAIIAALVARAPQAVLIGHSGSTSAHPAVLRLARAIRAALPRTHIIYGGVYPSHHWREVLEECPAVDVTVRGEGEVTAPRLIAALEAGVDLTSITGIAFRRNGRPHATAPAPMLRDLDSARVGWEVVDLTRHSYRGGKRAVVMQFSRGCPHLCTYCGQRGFWTQWRCRS